MRKVVVSADLIIPLVYEVEIPDEGDVDELAEVALRREATATLLKYASTSDTEIEHFNVEDVVP